MSLQVSASLYAHLEDEFLAMKDRAERAEAENKKLREAAKLAVHALHNHSHAHMLPAEQALVAALTPAATSRPQIGCLHHGIVNCGDCYPAQPAPHHRYVPPPGPPREYRTTDYCMRCGESPESGTHLFAQPEEKP